MIGQRRFLPELPELPDDHVTRNFLFLCRKVLAEEKDATRQMEPVGPIRVKV